MQQSITYTTKSQKKNWIIIDAKQEILGRLASKAALILRGKNKPKFTPNMDVGDFVIVINAKHIKVTGKKRTQKRYYKHSGYPGGLEETIFEHQLQKDARKVIMHAVKGMLPKNKLSSKLLTKLKVYNTDKHPHQAQLTKPELKKQVKNEDVQKGEQ